MELPRLEGASPEQRAIIDEILAGLQPTAIEAVEVRPFAPAYERDPDPPTGPHGEEIAIRSTPADFRGYWEAALLGRAFARRSRQAGLPHVAWLSYAEGGETLEPFAGRPASEPLGDRELDDVRDALAIAARPGSLDSFEVLEPEGHALAIRVVVGEPHAYLRFSAMELLRCVSEWRTRCDGIYGEIRDAEATTAALAIGWWRHGGMSTTRGDVVCCAPDLSLSSALGSSGPPPCPIFG
jgi:hypothetical protein